MSADNWAVCPSCLRAAEVAKAADEAYARDAYGKVDLEKFDVLRSKADEPIDRDALRTFREDYEFWLDPEPGTPAVEVRYKGWCTVCGSGVTFADSRPIEMKAPPVKA